MDRLRILQWALVAAGAVLLGFAAVSWLQGRAASRFDVARFEARQASRTGAAETAAPELPPDTTLWSPGRIRAFEETRGEDLGDVLGVLRIPSIGLVVSIRPGTDEGTLNRAAGWIEGTARPGGDGNVGLAAHRDGFFRGLKDLRLGAEVEVETTSGARRYVVVATSVVDPSAVEVLAPRETPAVTLVTCYPFYFVGSAPERFIVHAELLRDGDPHPAAAS